MSLTESTSLFLDTRFALNPSNPANGQWLSQMQLDSYGKTRVLLESASIPLTRPPIFSANKTIVFSENAGASLDINVTLDEREYTGLSFATEIGTKMTAGSLNGQTYTVVFSNDTKKLTITSDINDFRLESSTTALKEMGFVADGLFVASKEAEHTVRLDGTLFLDIVSNLATRNFSSDTRTNILARIPASVAFGTVLYFSNPTEAFSTFYNQDVNILELRLIDDEGRSYDVGANSSIQYTLRFIFA